MGAAEVIWGKDTKCVRRLSDLPLRFSSRAAHTTVLNPGSLTIVTQNSPAKVRGCFVAVDDLTCPCPLESKSAGC